MKNILILIFFVLFATGCSKIETKRNAIGNQEKLALIYLIEELKEELQYGKYQEFEKMLVPNIRNSILKNILEEVDFSKIKLFTSKPLFNGNRATNVVGMIVGGQTIYFDVEYLFKKGEWKILNFKEKRGER